MVCYMKSEENIIVLGANGFIGRNVVCELINKKYNVYSFVRNYSESILISELNGSCLVQYSLNGDIESNEDIIHDSIVINCAWSNTRDVLCGSHIEHGLEQLKFLSNLIVKGVKKIINLGTVSEFGIQYGPMSPNQEVKPCTPYGKAKVDLHKQCLILQEKYSFELLWVRLFYLYGKGQDEACIIPQFEKAIKNKEQFFEMSYGEQLLDYLPISKVSSGIVNLLKSESGIYHICNGKPISLRRLLEQRAAELDSEIKLKLGHYDYRSYESMAIWGSVK